MKTSTCRTAHTWKNMIRGSRLDVSLFSQVGKAIRDIWLILLYIGLRTKIYSAAFQSVNLSMYIITWSTNRRKRTVFWLDYTISFWVRTIRFWQFISKLSQKVIWKFDEFRKWNISCCQLLQIDKLMRTQFRKSSGEQTSIVLWYLQHFLILCLMFQFD